MGRKLKCGGRSSWKRGERVGIITVQVVFIICEERTFCCFAETSHLQFSKFYNTYESRLILNGNMNWIRNGV